MTVVRRCCRAGESPAARRAASTDVRPARRRRRGSPVRSPGPRSANRMSTAICARARRPPPTAPGRGAARDGSHARAPGSSRSNRFAVSASSPTRGGTARHIRDARGASRREPPSDRPARRRRSRDESGMRLALDDQRVVAHDLHRRRQPGEDAGSVVADLRRLAVHDPVGAHDVSAVRLADRLVSEADAERRDRRAPAANRRRP